MEMSSPSAVSKCFVYRLPLSHNDLLLGVNCGVKIFILYIFELAIEQHARVVNSELWCQMVLFMCSLHEPLPCGREIFVAYEKFTSCAPQADV